MKSTGVHYQEGGMYFYRIFHWMIFCHILLSLFIRITLNITNLNNLLYLLNQYLKSIKIGKELGEHHRWLGYEQQVCHFKGWKVCWQRRRFWSLYFMSVPFSTASTPFSRRPICRRWKMMSASTRKKMRKREMDSR